MKSKRKGLTFIEVLVVFAILGVVIALLLPFLANCLTIPPVEVSATFLGRVDSTFDSTSMDDGEVTHYAKIVPDNSKEEDFTVEHELPVEAKKRYAFRVWDTESPRHVTEAIPIP